MDGWNTTFLLGSPIFRGYVSFREGNQAGFHDKFSAPKNISFSRSSMRLAVQGDVIGIDLGQLIQGELILASQPTPPPTILLMAEIL